VVAAIGAAMVGCGLSDVGGLGGSTSLGDSDVVDSGSGFDATRVDSGTNADTFADETSDLGADTATAPDTADTKIDVDAGCPPIPEPDACKSVPRLVAPQVIDGEAGDFWCIPTTSFTIGSAAATDPKPPPPGLSEQVHTRAAWTGEGLAIHVHVVDPNVVVAPITDPNLYDADAVEVFVSGTNALTGTFDGVADPGAMQIIATPETASVPGRAKIYQSGDKGPLDAAYFATKLTTDGYSIELGLPWSLIRGAGTLGSSIALDVAIDVDDDATHAITRQVWAVWKQKSVPGTSACAGTTTSWAWCDDRSWCTPSLE
jgi:hypothetical protein